MQNLPLLILGAIVVIILCMSLYYNVALRRRLRKDLGVELEERRQATNPMLSAIYPCGSCGNLVKKTDRFCAVCGYQLPAHTLTAKHAAVKNVTAQQRSDGNLFD